MKKFPFLLIGLFLSVVLSLCLSYFLLFNSDLLFSFFSVTNHNGSTSSTNSSTVLAPTNEATQERLLKDLMQPICAIVGQDNQHYLVNDTHFYQDIIAYMEATPYNLSGVSVAHHEEIYQQLINSDRIELVYLERLPLKLQTHLFNFSDELQDEYEFNRIIFDLSDTTSFYFVNTVTHTYVSVPYHANQTAQDFKKLNKIKPDQWLRVERVQLKEDYTYLPVEGPKLNSQVYTLMERPENQYVRNFFGTGAYAISEGGTSDERKYQSVQNQIVINNQTKYYYAELKTDASQVITSKTNILTKAASVLNTYDNWAQEVRVEMLGQRLRFRRYLEGYPIISLARYDYGAVNMRLTNRAINFTGTMLNVFSHVADQSQIRQLASVDELIYVLNGLDYSTEEFTAIYIAYLWQEDMQNYQLATFEPTWVFQINDKIYTLQQVSDGQIERDRQTDSQSYLPSNSIEGQQGGGSHYGL